MPDGSQKAIASFVPDLVSGSTERRSVLEAAVLFVDAVSFTSRVAALVESGPQGIERLSALIDAQYAPQLRAVADHGGDVVRFVGDALIAVMPAEGRTLQEATLAAAACGRAIQEAPRPAMPDGEPLAVRVVVTAGSIVALRDVGPRSAHFVVAGQPLEDLAQWAPRAGPGEVVLAPSAIRASQGRIAGPTKDGALVADPVEAPLSRTPARMAPPRGEALRRFVPRPVLDRSESGHLDWLAELRRVTAVFVAIRGIEPGDVLEVIAQTRALAEQHEAFLKEIVLDDKGWTAVALTGVPPFAGVDDATRAVLFARDLTAALADRGLHAGAGVASGRAFCGAVGTVDRREYAVTGPVMNLAARLSQVAGPRIALCDEETAKMARGRVAFAALAPVSLKGFAAPVPVSALGDDVVSAQARGRLVGRDEEHALLVAAVDAASAVERTPAVVLEGEPGIGKSRLASDLLAISEAKGLARFTGVATAVSRSTAYHPWRDVMAAALRAVGAHDAGSLGEALSPEHAALAPLLEAVAPLGLKDNETTAQLAGQLRARRTREVCIALLRRASRTPTLVLLEDLHWADGASWDLLRDVVAAGTPGLLVIATSRPEASEELDAFEKSGGVRRRLGGLSSAATASVLAAALGVREVDPALASRLHERAAGNPLFAEQLALSLAESNAVKIEDGRCSLAENAGMAMVALPATVEGAITARLDRLSPAAQLAIKVASVIGPVFGRPLLVDIHPRAEDREAIDRHLAALRDAQLVVREGETDHRFRHELVRDVAYGTMLFEQRRVLHASVAAWYEREHAADLDGYLAVLAHHHRNAGHAERAAEYLERASVQTFRIGLPRQSVALGIDGASLLGVELPTDPSAVGARIGQLVGATMTRLAGRPPADLLALPAMTDPATIRTVRVLLELAPFTFQAGRPDLYALLGLTLFDLVLERGNAAPDVYSTYSVVHRAIHHDARGAYAWSELALALDERQGGAARARVAFVHDWFHRHWVRPLRESVAQSLAAAEAGLAAGDVLFGCYNLSGHVVYAAAAGRRLDEVIDVAEAHRARNGGRVVNAAFHCTHEMQVAKALAGRTRSPLSLTDDAIDEERDVASICATDFYNQVGYYLVSRVKLHGLFGDAEGALGWADKLGQLHAAIAGQVAEIDLVLFRTLAEIDLGLVERARAGAAEVSRWAEECPANFGHLAELLRAALAAREGSGDDALTAYARAASLAETEGFVQHAAMAHERAAALDPSGPHRARAIDAYRRWGAAAKVAALSST